MERRKLNRVSAGIAILLLPGVLGVAQEPVDGPARQAPMPAADEQRQKADGERHGLPMETFAVVPV